MWIILNYTNFFSCFTLNGSFSLFCFTFSLLLLIICFTIYRLFACLLTLHQHSRKELLMSKKLVMTVSLNIRISSDEFTLLTECAEKLNISNSKLVRIAITDAINTFTLWTLRLADHTIDRPWITSEHAVVTWAALSTPGWYDLSGYFVPFLPSPSWKLGTD